MKYSLGQIITSLLALGVAMAVVILVAGNPADFGAMPLLLRALSVNFAILALLLALYPVYAIFQFRTSVFAWAICLPAMLPALIYFLVLLPRQEGEGIEFSQLQNSLISDSSSNGIVEIGFAYPIFTPTVRLRNRELYTRQVSVFLRMINPEGQPALFRAVRDDIPEQGLSVEATVQGMLAENEDYLFNSLVLPPLREVSGKVVFIISNVDDGASFTEALRVASSVQLELRDPETGALLQEVPVLRD